MSYLLYSLSILCLILATALYLSRHHWIPHLNLPTLPITIPYIYTPLPAESSTFSDDAASGLHSATFDLSSNIEAGDSRSGLDSAGKREVQRVMRAKKVGFDEARRLVVMERFKKAGVGEDGRPKDPKFVSFS